MCSCLNRFRCFAGVELGTLYVTALVAHVLLTVVIASVIAALPKARDACVPITYTYFKGRPGELVNTTRADNSSFIRPILPSVGLLDGPGVCFTYVALAFVLFEVACLVFFLKATAYIQVLIQKINPYRWFFYSISASLMLLCILVTTGTTDLGALLGCIGCNVGMMICGYWNECVVAGQIEKHTKKLTRALNRAEEEEGLISDSQYVPEWAPFRIGCLLGIVPWVAILHSYIRTAIYSQPPWFVHGFLWQLFFFFNCFAYVEWRWTQQKPIMCMQKMDYVNKEWAYTFLSLCAKTTLALFIVTAAASM